MLVTGAGPIGLLAALMGMQRGLEVHVLDRNETGPKPALVRALGATYHSQRLAGARTLAPDIVIECTGAPAVIRDVLGRTAPDGIVCLAGVSRAGHAFEFDIGGSTAPWCSTTRPCSAPSTPTAATTSWPRDALARADKRLARAPDHAARAARALARGVRASAPTTSRSIVDFTA